MLVQERKGTASVCTCVMSCGPRSHGLICFWRSYRQPGWVGISLPLAQPLTLYIAKAWLYLSFIQGKQIKTCCSHGNAKHFWRGNWERLDLLFLQLVIWDYYLSYLLFICLFMYFGLFWSQLRITNCWFELCFWLFECWMKEFKHDFKNKIKRYKLEVYTFS